MDVYGKALATIEEVPDDERFGPNGGFIAVLSTPSLDRDGDRLERDEWVEPLPERLTLDADHGMSVATTVGSFRPYFDENKRLMMEATFSSIPRAQEVRTLVKERHIGTVSVAFMTDKSKKSGEQRRELLNAGIVAIPSNRDAVILDSKALDARVEEIIQEKQTKEPKTPTIYVDVKPRIDEQALKRVVAEVLTKAAAPGGDASLVQAIHDAAAHLGAICVVEPEDDGTGADDGANKSISFANEAGEKLSFGSHEEARKFFADMLQSIDDADKAGETLVEVGQTPDEKSGLEGLPSGTPLEMHEDGTVSVKDAEPLEAFEKALDEVLTPTDESPDESPAETAAASVEEPAPVVDAADESAEAELANQARAMGMTLALLSS